MTTCARHDWEDENHQCRECREEAGLVGCDVRGCEAKQEPQTLEELRVALEHWRRHHWLGGCSHGG